MHHMFGPTQTLFPVTGIDDLKNPSNKNKKSLCENKYAVKEMEPVSEKRGTQQGVYYNHISYD